MSGISAPLNEPYSGGVGSPTGSQSVSPSEIALDGRVYLIDTESNDWHRTGVDVVQQRNTGDSRDLLLLPQDVWRQAQQSWHYGSGQSNLDREDSLPYRFEESFGINPWNRWQISLLPSTAALTSTPTSNNPMFLATHNGSLVVGCAATLHWYSNPTTVVTQVPVAADNIISMTYDGDAVITLHASGKVHKSTSNSVTTLFGTFAGATFISYVKDYLLVGVANVLKNITSGTAVDVYTSPVTGFRWVGAAEGLTNIYLVGGSGDRSVVHSTQVNTAGTALEPCAVAAMLPDGEEGYSLHGYLGYLFIGTNKGVRMGVLSTQVRVTGGALTLGAIIPTTQPVYCFEGQDRYVWYGNSAVASTYTPTDEDELFPLTTSCGLGRLDLGTFTVSDATPAYANDIVALAQTSKTVTAVVTWNNKRVFAVQNGGVFYEQDELMEAGWLTQGLMSFSVEDDKTGLYMQTKWQPLEGSISLDVSYDSQPYSRITDLTIQNSIRSSNISLEGRQFSRVNVRYVLRRATDPTLGPVVTRWEMRAIPANGQASRWTIPILNHEEIEINGSPHTRDVLTELDTLMALYQSRRMFALQESGRTYYVQAKDFRWKPERLSVSGRAWQGTYTIVVEEIR